MRDERLGIEITRHPNIQPERIGRGTESNTGCCHKLSCLYGLFQAVAIVAMFHCAIARDDGGGWHLLDGQWDKEISESREDRDEALQASLRSEALLDPLKFS